MKTPVIAIATLLTASLTCLAGPKEDVAAAIKKLEAAGSYTWKMTWENSQFNAGPSTGKINKEGTALMSRSFGDRTILSVHQGEKAASETQDGWKSLAELEADQGPGRWTAMMLRNFTPAAKEAADLLAETPELNLQNDLIIGKLTETGAKQMLSFRRRGTTPQDGPEIRNASGSVKFWIENDSLKKYSYSVKGTMSFNGNDRDMDRTILVEISDVGTTQVEIPAEAKPKLQ
ncbi:MAG: hypothetical protein RI897_3169 [Verrucomicrobiota bacterium]|jgi:hypothetical protein